MIYGDGYYWASCPYDDTCHVVYYERGDWYTVGIEHPITAKFNPDNIIAPVTLPEGYGVTIH